MNDSDDVQPMGGGVAAADMDSGSGHEAGGTAPSTRSPVAAPARAMAERARTVPYGALAEERIRRKELQRELQDALDARQHLQGRLDVLQDLVGRRAMADEGAGAQRPGATATVDGSERPGDGPEEGDVGTPPEGSEPAAAEADLAFRTQVLQSVRNYVRERPDFIAAYQHARQARIGELSALGYGADEALAITFDNELEIIRNAYATGRNPAEVIYGYAVRRGFGAVAGGAPDSPRSQQPIARPVTGAMTEAERVALAARGQAGAKSLSAAGGGATGALTLEALAGLSDEEFAEATRGERWQRLLRS